MTGLIVLASAVPYALRLVDGILSDAGYLVAAVPTVDEAQHLLDSITPDLLIVDARLNAEAGLRLAMRSRGERPALPVIVAHGWDTHRLDGDAIRAGAEFVPASAGRGELLRRVRIAIERHRLLQPMIRRWVRRAPPAAMHLRAANSQARVVDVSHGGVRLTFDRRTVVSPTFEITLPNGPTVRARRAWRAEGSQIACGAEIDAAGRNAWRRWVDSIAPAL
jgi:DNA-binding response OmpR family regulator